MAETPETSETPETPPEPMIMVVNPANPGQSLLCPVSEYDAAIHTRWEDRDMDRGTLPVPPPPEEGAMPMPAVPTVEIVDPKNKKDKWIINADDYNPEEHILWEDRDKPRAAAKRVTEPPKGPEMAKSPEPEKKG